MKKKSTVQIILDTDGNLRYNNLSRKDYNYLFNVADQEQSLKNKQLPITKRIIDLLLLKEEIQCAKKLYNKCNICFRDCRVNRTKGEIGWCGLNSDDYIYMADIIAQEEEFISPTYAVYFSSCNINCSYCHQRYLMKLDKISDYLTVQDVVNDISNNFSDLKSISFIGGNPDLSIVTILKIISLLENNGIHLPYALNSNFLFSNNIYQILHNNFDILMPDIKFWNDKCSRTICGFENYRTLVQTNIMQFFNKKTCIIRHLPLKNHWICCSKPIIDWVYSLTKKSELYSISFLEMLYYDNSKEVDKCYSYSQKLGLNLS